MFGFRKSKYPSFNNSRYERKKRAVHPLLTVLVLLIGVYLAWSSVQTRPMLSDSIESSDVRASLDPERLLNESSADARSGIFPLSTWDPEDAHQRDPRAMKKNLATHWYKDALPNKLEAYFTLNDNSDFFEILFATDSSANYGIRLEASRYSLFYDAVDKTRKILSSVDLPESLKGHSAILDLTEEHMFIALAGQLVDTSEIEQESLKALGLATSLTLADVQKFDIENNNGEQQKLAG